MSPIAVRSLVVVFVFALQVVTVGRVYGQAEDAVPGQTVQPAAPLPLDRTVILAVTVNGLAGDPGAVFLQDDAGHLYAPATFLAAWNLLPGTASLAGLDGTGYFELPVTDGFSYHWDHARAELAITAVADQFIPTSIRIGEGRVRDAAPYSPGGFLNYDLSLTQSPGASSNSAFFDLALFRGKGLLTSSQLASDEGSARLMTTWQMDKVGKMKTLRIGDSYNNTGAWGRGVLFGGIQYGTNFAVRPDFIPFATPSISGTTLLPSTVDVYVNNALRSRQQVNAGPFSIQNLPVLTGNGEVQVVVRDVLGREQLLSQPFFASPVLLSKGLVDDSFELGWLRNNYGLASNDYGHPFAAMNYRKGMSNRLTAETSVEVQQDVLTGGASIAALLSDSGSVVESSLVLSTARGLATGAMASIRYGYSGRRWSANARMQLYSADFRQIGSNPDRLPEQIVNAHLSTPLAGGTLSVNYLRRLSRGESLTRIINLSYTRKLFGEVFATATVLKPLSTSSGTVVAISVIYLIGQQHVGSVTMNRQDGGAGLAADFQRAIPTGTGTGYRLSAMQVGSIARQEASLTANQSFGTLQLDLVHLDQSISSRLSASGSIATLGDGMYFSRGLDQGFAVVATSDLEGVPVLLENQVVAHTNRNGRALVRNLQPYQPNRIGIDPLMLPLESSVGAVELTVVPRQQGGVLVDFKLRRTRSVILTLVLTDGTPVPPWTTVTVDGLQNPYVVGKRGEVFVELPMTIGNRVIIGSVANPLCQLTVDQPAAGNAAPFSGPLTCTPTP